MHLIISILFLAFGLLGLFRPRVFYRQELLGPQQIKRNERIFFYAGMILTTLGTLVLILSFAVK